MSTLKPYRLQLLQALTRNNKGKRMEFCSAIMEKDEAFFSRLIFSNEAIFHLSGHVNCHVWIWGTEHPHETAEHQRDSLKVNVFCAVSNDRVCGPFFFEHNTVTGRTYLEMLRIWLFPLLQAHSHDFVFLQDEAPPHWHGMVRAVLNETLP